MSANLGCTRGVKTTVSIPGDLFERAEELASRLGISRSQLYTDALRGYLAWRHEESIREALDAVHEGTPEALDEDLKRAQSRVLRDR